MNKYFSEEFALLINIGKWLCLATIAGLLVGLSTTLFLTILHGVIDLSSGYTYSFLLLPVGLMASAWITSSFAPEAGGQGIERVIQAVHYRSGKIHAQVIPAKLIATLLTIGVGGSAGSVGPCAQIGGGLTSIFSDLCKFDDADRKTLVICGISAGFASVLGAPIAGAFFGVEALFVGSLGYQVLLPSVISATVAHQVALGFGVDYLAFSLGSIPAFSLIDFPWVILGGIFFGFCAILFIESITLGMRVSTLLNVHPAVKGLLGGFAILGMASLFSSKILGLGGDVIQDTIQAHHVLLFLFFGKIVVTSITLNFGGSGGIILPICFVGTTAGAFFGTVLDLPIELFATLGLAGLVAGAINTPLTAVLLTIELFGLPVGAYAIVVCAISFLISGHRSAIPTQLLQISKAPAIHADLNQEISLTDSEVDPWSTQLKPFRDILRRSYSRVRKPKKQDNP